MGGEVSGRSTPRANFGGNAHTTPDKQLNAILALSMERRRRI